MKNKGFRIWLARALLLLLAVIILLPMAQTFLYSFSSMAEIKALPRDVLLILEVFRVTFPEWQVSRGHVNYHSSDLAAMEMNVLFLENAEEMTRRRAALVLP